MILNMSLQYTYCSVKASDLSNAIKAYGSPALLLVDINCLGVYSIRYNLHKRENHC